MVRCASCSASWRASPEPPAPLELSAVAEEPAPMAAPAEAPASESGLVEARAAERPADELPKAFRARAETERRTREWAVQSAIWTGIGAVFALLIGAGVVFRSDVVTLWPRTASAYASVGLPVNPVGLAIEDVKFQHGLQDGHPALVVSGMLRNIRPRAVTSPPLRIVLMDRQGKTLLARTAEADESDLAPGQSRSFRVSLLDPPMFASDLEVSFAPSHDAPRLRSRTVGEIAPPPPAAPHPDAPATLPRAMSLSPPIPDAKPLPPGSPYALNPAGKGGA